MANKLFLHNDEDKFKIPEKKNPSTARGDAARSSTRKRTDNVDANANAVKNKTTIKSPRVREMNYAKKDNSVESSYSHPRREARERVVLKRQEETKRLINSLPKPKTADEYTSDVVNKRVQGLVNRVGYQPMQRRQSAIELMALIAPQEHPGPVQKPDTLDIEYEITKTAYNNFMTPERKERFGRMNPAISDEERAVYEDFQGRLKYYESAISQRNTDRQKNINARKASDIVAETVKNADFEEKVQIGKNKDNLLGDMGQPVEVAFPFVNYMTEEERNVFFYLNAIDSEKAWDFAALFYDKMNKAKEDEAFALGKEHPWQAVLEDTKNIPETIFSSILLEANSLLKGLSGQDQLDPHSLSYTTSLFESSKYKEGIKENTNAFVDVLVDLGFEARDILIATAINSVAPGAGTAFNVASNLGAVQIDAYKRGATPLQAATIGAATSAIEYLTEKFSLGNLQSLLKGKSYKEGVGFLSKLLKYSPNDSTFKKFMKVFSYGGLSQFGAEGSEELISGISSTVLDYFVMGDKSNINLAMKDYMRNGLTEGEAVKAAMLDKFLKEPAFDFAVGGFMGYAIGNGAGLFNAGKAVLGAPKAGSVGFVDGNGNEYVGDRKSYIANDADGGKVVVLTENQGLFSGLSYKEMLSAAKNLLNEKFRNNLVPLSEYNLLFVNKTGINKYINSTTTPEFAPHKMKATGEFENILESAEYIGHSKDSKNHPFAKYGFDYYKTTFVSDGQVFEGIIDVGVSEKGAFFYGMSNIKRVTGKDGKYLDLLSRLTSAYSDNSSNDRVSQNGESVNSNFMQNSEKDAGRQNLFGENGGGLSGIDAFRLGQALIGSENSGDVSSDATVPGAEIATRYISTQEAMRLLEKSGVKITKEQAKNLKNYHNQRAELARAIARVFGVNVRFGGVQAGAVAQYEKGTNTIYLNPSEKVSVMRELAEGHEIVHALEQTPNYDKISKLVIENVFGGLNSDAYIKESSRIDALYKRMGTNLTPKALQEEVVAEYFRTKVFKDAETLTNFIIENHETLGKQFFLNLKGISDKVKQVFNDKILGKTGDVPEVPLSDQILTEFATAMNQHRRDRNNEIINQRLDAVAEGYGLLDRNGTVENGRRNMVTDKTSKNSDATPEALHSDKFNPDVQAKFEQDVDNVLNGTMNSDDVLILGTTPKLYTDIGLNKLPVTMTQKHVYSVAKTAQEAILEGRYNKNENYHGMGSQAVKEIYKKLNNPIAIVAHPDFVRKNTRDSTHKIIALVDLTVNGKQVIAPIEIDASREYLGNDIDSNAIVTYFDKKNVSDILKEAVALESMGKTGFFYGDKKRIEALLKTPGYQLPDRLRTHDSNIIIRHIGENVNRKFDTVLKSTQFKRWFGDWQNNPLKASKVVNKDGTPKVVYHGTNKEFEVFGSKDGTYWFSESYDYAESMSEERGGNNVMQAYLDIKNPFYTSLPEGKFSDPFAEKSIIAEARSKGHDGVIIECDTDNELVYDKFYVAFNPTQIKSATDNIGTFDKSNPNVKYLATESSVKEFEDAGYNSIPDEAFAEQARLEAEEFLEAPDITAYEDVAKRYQHERDLFDGALKDVKIGRLSNTEYLKAVSGDIVKAHEIFKNVRRRADNVIIQFGDDYGRIEQREVERLLSGDLEVSEISSRANKDVVLKAYGMLKHASDMEHTLWDIRRASKSRYTEFAKSILNDSASFKSLKGRKMHMLTPREALKQTAGTTDFYSRVEKEVLLPMTENSASINRDHADYIKRIKDIGISKKKIKGDALSEDAIIQCMEEIRGKIEWWSKQKNYYKSKENQTSADEKKIKEAEDFISEQQNDYKRLLENNPSIEGRLDELKEKGKKIRAIYDELFDRINKIRVENGYEPIGYRHGYFMHYSKTDIVWWKQYLGLTDSLQERQLSTALLGVTEHFSPGMAYSTWAQSRSFDQAQEYSVLRGFDNYLPSALDVIHHTEDIQRFRALENELRNKHMSEESKKQIERIKSDESKSFTEQIDEINEIYQKDGSGLGNLAVFFHEQANVLANKKSHLDRPLEKFFSPGEETAKGGKAKSKRAYTIFNGVKKRTIGMLLGFNVSTAFSNTEALMACSSDVSNTSFLKAGKQMVENGFRDDGFKDSSVFLSARGSQEQLDPLAIDKFQNASMWMMEKSDMFVSEWVTRAYYNDGLKKGLSPEAAMEYADEKASDCIGDRSKGMMPLVFSAKNPAVSIITTFQLEVNNRFQWLFRNMSDRAKEKGLAGVASFIFGYCLRAYLFNDLYEKLLGRRIAFDPLSIANEAAGDLTGYKLDNFTDIIQNAVSDHGLDFFEETKKTGAATAIINSSGNVIDQLPFVSTFTGGRVPLLPELPDGKGTLNTVFSSELSGKEKLELLGEEMAPSLLTLALPAGGNQLKKTAQGAIALMEGGRYKTGTDGKRKIGYPVDANHGNVAKGLLFGRSAFDEARDWANRGYSYLPEPATNVYDSIVKKGVPKLKAFDTVSKVNSADAVKGEDGFRTTSRAGARREVLINSDLPADVKNYIDQNLIQQGEKKKNLDYSQPEFVRAVEKYRNYTKDDDGKSNYEHFSKNLSERQKKSLLVTSSSQQGGLARRMALLNDDTLTPEQKNKLDAEWLSEIPEQKPTREHYDEMIRSEPGFNMSYDTYKKMYNLLEKQPTRNQALGVLVNPPKDSGLKKALPVDLAYDVYKAFDLKKAHDYRDEDRFYTSELSLSQRKKCQSIMNEFNLSSVGHVYYFNKVMNSGGSKKKQKIQALMDIGFTEAQATAYYNATK